MIFNRIAPFAALCLLAGCVTTGSATDPTPVDTWQGIDVRGTMPPLEFVAAANIARSQGRVLGGPRREGGAYVLTPAAQLPATCANPLHVEDGPLVACTVRGGGPGGWVYTVYVADNYPSWYRELLATREFGYVGQSEYGQPADDAAFTNPSVGLIRRLGG